jgi:anti-anti-sigma regulatory factor
MSDAVIDASTRELLDALSTPVVLIDADATILHLNEAWRSTFLYGVPASSEDFEAGRRYTDSQSDVLGAGTADAEAIAAALRGERSEQITRHACGDEVWWIRTRVLPQGQGPERRVVIEKEDVTERMAPEESVLRYQATLQAFGFAASRFLGGDAWEASVGEVLGRLGEALDVSRVYVFEALRRQGDDWIICQRYEWAAAGVSAEIDNPEMSEVSCAEMGIGDWPGLMSNGRTIAGPTRAIPEPMRGILEAQSIQAFALSPILLEGVWWGFLGCDECRTERVWTPAELESLRTAAGLFGAALQGRRVAEARKHSLAQEEIIRAQEAALRELAAPLIPVHEQILVMPLVGAMDAARVDRAMDTLLEGIARRGTRVAILDVTGVRRLDEGAATALTRLARALELLGAEVVLTGVSSEVARTLVEIRADLEGIETAIHLQAGIAYAMRRVRSR